MNARLLPLSLCAFIVNLGYGVVIPVLPTLVATSATGVGIFYGVFSATKLPSQLFGGVWADQRGAVRVLAVAVLLYAGSLTGIAAAESSTAITLWRALEGVAVGLSYPCVSAIVLAASTKEAFARNHGAVLGVSGAGMVIGPIVATVIGSALVRPLLWGVAAAAVISVVPLFASSAPGAKPAPTRTLGEATGALFAYLSAPAFLRLLPPIAFGKLSFSIMQPLIPVRGAALGLEPRTVGLLFGMNGVLFALAQPLAARLSGRYGAERTAFAALCLAIVFVCAASIDHPHGFAACVLLYATAGGVVFGANTALVGEHHHAVHEDHAKVFAAMHMATDVGMIAAPIFFMWGYARAPSTSFAMLGTLGAILAAVFGWRVIFRR